MKKIFGIIWVITCASCTNNTKTFPELPENLAYEPNWESLSTNPKEPEWFKDAKLGIYFHWGVYSVPAYYNEWYPRWMYFKDRGDKWGWQVNPYHEKTYGSLDEFNYHDFVPMFKAEQFDAQQWVSAFKLAGARFAGPVAQHHDGFAMWASDVNPWNVQDMGPLKDITGLLYKELRKHDIKTIATFHHARLGQRYAKDTANWAGNGPDVGWDSHYPYHPDLITSTTDSLLRRLYGNLEIDEFHDYWLNQVKEVVDKYGPDMIWFDSWLDEIPDEYRSRMVAHHFNSGVANNQEPLVAYKQEDLPDNVGVLDIEQGGKTDISEDYWLTDITISRGSWCYTKDLSYKEPELIIRNMIDVWSKKGIVLLNVSPRADGVIPEKQLNILNEIGAWIRKHEEAVYETRTYTIYGYGAAAFEEGHFGGQSATMTYSNNDFRFTTSKDGKSIYVYVLGMPEANASLAIGHIVENLSGGIKRVSVVGDDSNLTWSIDNNELVIKTPDAAKMDEVVTVFKIEVI
ncbi:MAG: alpha-L-fucosidase [Cyclobacteriaceae bacterium]